MGRAPCCDKSKVKRGPWSPEEDATLKNYLQNHGTPGNWISLPLRAGLKRCGKSCRLRWLNYLRPDIKHGPFTDDEDAIILSLYDNLGSRWSVIASKLAGRTDNDVKNHWNTKLKKKFTAAKDNHITSNYHSPNSTSLDHRVSADDQFPVLISELKEFYKPEFSVYDLTQNPTSAKVTSSVKEGNSSCINSSSEASSSAAAVENCDYHMLWSGGNGGGYCGMKNDIGFSGMDYTCYDFTGGFWTQENTGLEDVLFS